MKILLIEDDALIRQNVSELLEMNGHTVLPACDGIEGIRMAKESPDLILCDIGLPGVDGYGVIDAVRSLPGGRDVPFIFLTARADRGDQRRGMALGADDYITKPFTERELLDAISARVGRLRPLRERIEQLMSHQTREISAKWSHELLTPLAGVLGGLELIEGEIETVSRGELKDLLGLIRQGAERQRKLSAKLIRYFELERLKAAPPLDGSECHAGDAVAAGAAAADGAEPRKADLQVRCEPGSVCLPGRLLEEAVAELVENALRFSRPGQPVGVTGTRGDGSYRIEIADQGPGMSAAERQGVGAFAQFDRKNREQQGLGLGLAIAQATAAIAGGSLTLEAPGEGGLRVVMKLPLRAASD